MAEGALGSPAAQTGLSPMSKSRKHHRSLGRHSGRKPLRAEMLLLAVLGYITVPDWPSQPAAPPLRGRCSQSRSVAQDQRGAHGNPEALSSSGSGSEP